MIRKYITREKKNAAVILGYLSISSCSAEIRRQFKCCFDISWMGNACNIIACDSELADIRSNSNSIDFGRIPLRVPEPKSYAFATRCVLEPKS